MKQWALLYLPLYPHKMASIHKLPHSPNWTAFYRTRDGKQRCKTTGMRATRENRVAAERFAEALEQATRDVRMIGRLRKVVDDLAADAGEEARQPSSVHDYCNGWLDAKRGGAVAASSLVSYTTAVTRFLEWLGEDAARDMMSVTRRRLEEYRRHLADALSAATANHAVKILRMIFRRARLDGVIFTDPAEGVALVKVQRQERRRPFTVAELRAVLAIADEEWRGLVLFGLYSGQRLGDVARLTWANVDLAAEGGCGELRLVTGKTGRSQFIPLHTSLRDYLATINAGDDPRASLFPRAAAAVAGAGGRVVTLSNQFAEILAAAGLRGKVSHVASRQVGSRRGGAGMRKEALRLSFHSLRHTATSLLKSAGIPSSVVMDLIGHDDAAMSQHYTHTGDSERRRAVDSLPVL